jgi:hypothetical protein
MSYHRLFLTQKALMFRHLFMFLLCLIYIYMYLLNLS